MSGDSRSTGCQLPQMSKVDRRVINTPAPTIRPTISDVALGPPSALDVPYTVNPQSIRPSMKNGRTDGFMRTLQNCREKTLVASPSHRDHRLCCPTDRPLEVGSVQRSC